MRIGPRSKVGRVLLAILQAAALVAAGWFLVKTARASWPELSRLRVTVALGPLLAASVLTSATYVYLVAAWVSSLERWSPPQHLAFRPALRVWFLTNLARFIPGTVWQFAGLAAMAAERGISPVAATGAILVQQLVLLATGILVTLAVTPTLLGAGALWVGAGAVVLFLAALGLRRYLPWKPSGRAAVLYVSALTVPWIAYGVAFWLFGRSLLGAEAPGLILAVGAFTASYVAGIVAVFAPGGLVVREAALVVALAPAIGADQALLLALGSRLWLVAVELVTAAVVLLFPKT